MDPLPFSIKPPLLPPSPQTPLNHVSGLCRPYNKSFGDLDLHGQLDILALV
jgi:hypothetical protein